MATRTKPAKNLRKLRVSRTERPGAAPSARFGLTGRQSASNKTPRTINRNLVFNLIRTHPRVSRADLARLSGLQRSTISLIVEDLIADRWILEGSTGRLPRGRRPTSLELNGKRAVVAIDIHPLQTAVAITSMAGTLDARRTVTQSEDGAEAIRSIVDAVVSLLTEHKEREFDGIGISIPGRPDPQLAHPAFTPRLSWPVQALKSQLAEATGLRVEMENVANACALAEVWFGESDGLQDLVVVNVSEGIGTGIFANGRLLRGQANMAGEFGHVQMGENGPLCACGAHGCWESFASNRAGLRYFAEMSGRSAPATFEELTQMAQEGDPDATAALLKMAAALGAGLRMIASALAPPEIVMVGEITGVWAIVGPTLEASRRHPTLSPSPRLRPAGDGSAARLRSAVAMVMNEGVS